MESDCHFFDFKMGFVTLRFQCPSLAGLYEYQGQMTLVTEVTIYHHIDLVYTKFYVFYQTLGTQREETKNDHFITLPMTEREDHSLLVIEIRGVISSQLLVFSPLELPKRPYQNVPIHQFCKTMSSFGFSFFFSGLIIVGSELQIQMVLNFQNPIQTDLNEMIGLGCQFHQSGLWL